MKDLEIIELFKERKILINSMGDNYNNRGIVVDNFVKTNDPDVIMSSVKKMLDTLNRIRVIDQSLLELLNNDLNLFNLYGYLADEITNENYEEASILKKEIEIAINTTNEN